MNTAEIAEVLATVYDPELGIDVVSLGLIYGIEDGHRWVRVTMTTTTRECPMGAVLIRAVEDALSMVRPGRYLDLRVTHEPPWDPAMLSTAARRHLGLG